MSGTQEFTVKIPERNDNKDYYVMKFNSSLGVDVAKWSQVGLVAFCHQKITHTVFIIFSNHTLFCIFQVRMVRENNQKTKAGQEEEQPKFGAGSEFGREQKEEARRKKFGFVSKKYNPDAQPWLMRVGSKKDGKHYRGE